jgi:transcriptional regulator with XRE-family HTH domain
MKTEFDRELDEIFSNVDERSEADARLALDIASQFTALRQRRGLSQKQLAEKIGKTRQVIAKIEHPGHAGDALARLKEAVDALGATLEVTIVPLEDLARFRAVHLPKPALECADDHAHAAPADANSVDRGPERDRAAAAS